MWTFLRHALGKLKEHSLGRSFNYFSHITSSPGFAGRCAVSTYNLHFNTYILGKRFGKDTWNQIRILWNLFLLLHPDMFKLSKQIQGISIIENKTFFRISTLVSVDVKTSDKEFPGGTREPAQFTWGRHYWRDVLHSQHCIIHIKNWETWKGKESKDESEKEWMKKRNDVKCQWYNAGRTNRVTGAEGNYGTRLRRRTWHSVAKEFSTLV